jgi:chlorobactene glucosyltransferase
MKGTLLVLLGIFLLHAASLLFRRLKDEERSPRLASFPPPPAAREDWPTISIVVPARNEEKHLATCIGSLRSIDYPALEIVIVNDRSTDSTGAMADQFAREDGRVKVVQGQDTPEGWTGKNYAIHQGTVEAGGEYLLIADADSVLAPDALKQAVHYTEQEEVDLLTLYPSVVCDSFWERALLPWLGVLSTFRMDRVNDPDTPEAMAYGYFLFFRRASFDKVGGHKAIRDRVGEDWIIARRLKSMGLRLRMLMGTEYVTKRFGPSLAEIWQGFTKNFILIMEGNKWVAALALPMMIYYLLFTVLPWAILAAAPLVLLTAGWNSFWALAFLLAALQICMLGAVRALLKLFTGVNVSSPWLQPLGGIVVTAMGLSAIHRTLSDKGIVWKGREYKNF